jgi:hypothetical protein
MDLFVMQQLAQDTELYSGRAQMITVPPICPLAASPYDFSHAGEMIDKAARSTESWLEQGGLTDSEPLAAAQERSIATARVRARDVAIELREACGAQLPSCVGSRECPLGKVTVTAERLKPTQLWQPRAIAVLKPPGGARLADAGDDAFPRSRALFYERRANGTVIERRRPRTAYLPDMVNG